MRRIHTLNTYMKRLLELYLLEIQRFENALRGRKEILFTHNRSSTGIVHGGW